VSDHTAGIVEIRTPYDTAFTSSNRRDVHGEAGGNPTNKSGYGLGPGTFLECMDCHAPHNGARNSSNLFQMKDVLHSLLDSVTPIPSDGSDTTYSLIDNNVDTKGQDQTTFFDYKQGYYYCNTCHTGSMGSGKSNCQSCHNHSSGNF
jgi:hypothetical protein